MILIFGLELTRVEPRQIVKRSCRKRTMPGNLHFNVVEMAASVAGFNINDSLLLFREFLYIERVEKGKTDNTLFRSSL